MTFSNLFLASLASLCMCMFTYLEAVSKKVKKGNCFGERDILPTVKLRLITYILIIISKRPLMYFFLYFFGVVCRLFRVLYQQPSHDVDLYISLLA